jgi:hypothetical protein
VAKSSWKRKRLSNQSRRRIVRELQSPNVIQERCKDIPECMTCPNKRLQRLGGSDLSSIVSSRLREHIVGQRRRLFTKDSWPHPSQ